MGCQVLQQPKRSLVGPVQVVEQYDDRLAGTQASEQVDEDRVEPDASLLLRLQLGRLGNVGLDASDLWHESRQVGGVLTQHVPQPVKQMVDQLL